MLTNIHRISKILSLVVVSILLVAFTSAPNKYINPSQPTVPNCTDPNAYLELSIVPRMAVPGTIVTLNIAYHRIGLPYAYIGMAPTGLADYEPPISMPCVGCTSVTLLTQATGVVQFHAGATGELWGEDCHCWCMGGVSDNGPATLVIVETISKMFLPSVFR